MLLSLEQKNYFLNVIAQLRETLNAVETDSTLQELERFENRLTLRELEECFFDANFETKLVEFLAKRWERIRGSSMCYTQKPFHSVNQLCLELAKAISPPTNTPSEINALAPNTGPYCLLMPSLESTVDTYSVNIHRLGLHEFVLSDNERLFIPLVACLDLLPLSDDGRLKHVVTTDDKYPALTASEVDRVVKHSKPVTEYYQSISALNRRRLLADDISVKLTQLAVALRGGSVAGSGSEYNAGAAANVGIVAFRDYWQELSDPQKEGILKTVPELSDIIGRLFRPDDANYQEVWFCVHLLAEALDTIIERYNKRPSIEALQEKVNAQSCALMSALEKPEALIIAASSNPPRHILYLISELAASEQKKLFKGQYENAAIYAVAHDLDALSEFEINDSLKQQVINARIGNCPILVSTVKSGKINTVELLLSWGASTEACDNNKDTALNWAAHFGYVDIVACLLDHGASPDSQGYNKETPLINAVKQGQKEVVQLLLAQGANMNIRDRQGNNALDLAIKKKHRELVNILLMHAATLPLQEQSESLLNVPEGSYPSILSDYLPQVPGGPYPNVFSYVMARKPVLFPEIIEMWMQKNDPKLVEIMCNTHGNTLLYAAQLGIHESIPKLLDLGMGIESHDANGSTALHWAAYNGHIDAVNCLLKEGASLEARGAGNNTTLNFAVMRGQRAVVERLLQENADVNARNTKGKNALDLAVEKHPELIDTLLMHAATLPLEKQSECLLHVPGGPYPHVLFYVMAKKSALFDAIIEIWIQKNDPEWVDVMCNAKNKKGENALIIAAQLGLHERIPQLLDLGLNIESSDANGSTALHWAAFHGHVEAVNCLLAARASLEALGDGNHSALNFAVMRGQRAVVELLLARGANINVRSSSGKNAFDLAIEEHPELVELFLMHLATLPLEEQAECLLNVSDGPYPNVLFYVAAKRPDLFGALITQLRDQDNVDLSVAMCHAQNQHGANALLLAAQLGAHQSIPNILLLVGQENIELRDAEYNTALHYTAYYGHTETARVLLHHGASIDSWGSNNETPLTIAVSQGKEDLVALLLARGANVNARNAVEKNALDLAIEQHPELVDLLLMHIATLPLQKQAECLLNVPDGPYSNVLLYVMAKKHALFDAIIEMWVQKGDPELLEAMCYSENQEGENALLHATQVGSYTSASKLLNYGAWVDSQGVNNETPLIRAVSQAAIQGKQEFIELLFAMGASISIRNSAGENALDIALEQQPELVEPILLQLATLPVSEQEQCLLNVPGGPYSNVFSYAATTANTLLLKKLFHSFGKNAIDSNMEPIHEHIHQIGLHYNKMKEKASRNTKYHAAVTTAATLLDAFVDEMLHVYHSSDPLEVKMQGFKSKCQEAIETARPVLKKYREWGKVLAAALLALITLPVSLPLCAARFFSVKTKSEQLLNNLQSSVNNLEL